MRCPVCGHNIESGKSFCRRCAWSILRTPDEPESDYNERLEIARRNWENLERCICQKEAEDIRKEHKILFCTDLYASSDYAFKAAVNLARERDAELIIFHVLESRHRYSGQIITADGETWATKEVFDRLKKSLTDYYLAKIEGQPVPRIRIEARSGVPWIEIIRKARKEKVDMIVMGPYSIRDPKNGFDLARPQHGETAEKVSLRAPCPVAIVTKPDQKLSLEQGA
ncbi:MAG: universal stress protein [Deltaproteobacteria bacterium]|nr:universal stress protein [Deltaproteobacteria bacterium]MBW2068616.1 universal stress protein [Deltaproteobacteria bacterium]